MEGNLVSWVSPELMERSGSRGFSPVVPDLPRVRGVDEDAGLSEWTKGCSRFDKSDLFRVLWTYELSDAVTSNRVRLRESLCSLVSS